MAMLQLDPPLPLRTKNGRRCTAYLVLDYGPEFNTLFLVGIHENRQLWWLPQSSLRLDDNISMGRMPASGLDPDPPTPTAS